MEEKLKINWKSEDNNYLNKIFDILNLVLVFIVILSPIITSLSCLIGVEMDVLNVLLIFYALFILGRIMFYSINFRFIKFRKLDLMEILGLSLVVMLIVSALANGAVNVSFVFTLGYVLVFLAFVRLDKKYYKTILWTFITTIVFCSVMGLCDLSNSYMPGFVKNTFPMSLQFYNPNYSAYITVMAIMLIIYVLHTCRGKAEQVLGWCFFTFLNVALFINGCFSAETAMFAGELFLFVYLWIKNKKCPWKMLVCLAISIGASFVWIRGVSTSGANYMFEALAVIDGKLHTHLVKDISTFFDKIFHTGIIDGVAGSDGWDRDSFKKIAWQNITSSPLMFFFGGGAGYNYEVLVHNVYLQIWLEYGIFNLLLYLSILIVLAVRVFKSGFSSHNIFIFTLMCCVVIVCHYFGCLDPYSFTYYVCLLAICVKNVNEKDKERKNDIEKKDSEGQEKLDKSVVENNLGENQNDGK